MRIAIVGEYPLDASRIWGGVQAASAYLVEGLLRIHDLQVHVLTPRSRDWAGPNRVEHNAVTIHLLPSFPRFERAKIYRTYQSALNQKLAQLQPDVVHAQDTTAHAFVAVRSGYLSVVTVHGIRREDGKYYSSFGRRMRNYFDSLLIERYILRHARHLIAIGHYVTDYFAPQLPSDAQVHYVPNAIKESYFNLVSTSDGRTILFAGRVIPRKRVFDLVRAFAQVRQQVPSAKLRIAGECRSEASYVASIRGFIQQSDLEDQIQLLGALQEDAILREFAGCAVLALPSIQETTPMVIAQAMAAGKPVVATRVGGVPEMISDGATGFLVDVGDVDGLAKVLLRLLNDRPLRERLGRSGHQFAAGNYRADIVAQRTFDVYRRMTVPRIPSDPI